MKYRKKSIEVEACLIHDIDDWEKSPEWVADYSLYYQIPFDPLSITCSTASGPITAICPIWIIREPDGIGCYPCTIEVFDKNYEKV